MGNGITKNPCFTGDPYAAAVASDPPPDDSLGHSFTYVPSSAAAFDHPPAAAAAMMSEHTTFFSLSGAAISANAATCASMPSFQLYNEMTWPQSACTFESSRSFASEPLQAAPPRLSLSGPLQAMSGRFSETSGTTSTVSDGPFLSGALDRSSSSTTSSGRLQPMGPQLVAERRAAAAPPLRRGCDDQSLLGFLSRTASRLRFRSSPRYAALPNDAGAEPAKVTVSDGDYRSPPKNGNVEWAQGVAGEDRFHVAVSEEHGWLFVGIYDGFNGRDAADYLFAHLYVAVHAELKGVLWDDIHGAGVRRQEPEADNAEDIRLAPAGADCAGPKRRRTDAAAAHRDVLRALARALRRTEEAFFEAAEQRAADFPDLGLVGSCVLVMLMKGADAYVMSVGDSRAVLARTPEPQLDDILGKAAQDLQQFKREIFRQLQARDRYGLQAVQLTPDHSTEVEEEVGRIKSQHLDDRNVIVNRRVKGKINITRAFGVAYLKQPKWNDRLLEIFKIKYVGTEPYVTCNPSLCHHRIGSHDKFLVLSSDGLYQFFTNKEVVDEVESFTAQHPEGDPAKHLVAEVVLRAARKAGMTPHELLEIPQGARRKYHDDVSIIVISFEGGIWRSFFSS